MIYNPHHQKYTGALRISSMFHLVLLANSTSSLDTAQATPHSLRNRDTELSPYLNWSRRLVLNASKDVGSAAWFAARVPHFTGLHKKQACSADSWGYFYHHESSVSLVNDSEDPKSLMMKFYHAHMKTQRKENPLSQRTWTLCQPAFFINFILHYWIL